MSEIFGVVRIFVALACAAALATAPARAEDADSSEAADDEIVLPLPRTTLPAGVIIDGSNVSRYRNLIIPDLVSLVRSGKFPLDAVAKLNFAWRLDDEWEAKNKSPTEYGLDEQGAIKGTLRLARGLIFGDATIIGRESDRRIRGTKVLWNIISQRWSDKAFRLRFTLSDFSDHGAQVSLDGDLTRVYPLALDPKDTTGQLFRERLVFSSPRPLAGFSWLTFRFFGADEDNVWVFSPAISKVRQLTGSNRSDSILRTAASPDDVLGWSGKIDLVDANFDREMVALVPFPSIDLNGASVLSSHCLRIADDDSRLASRETTGKWNFQSKRFMDAAAWAPSQVVFVPRKLWRIELAPKDPFSLYGRQILFVDVANMLPIYKLVYDRSGRLWKVVTTAFGIGATRDRSRRAPFAAFTLINDVISGNAAVIDYHSAEYCDSLPEGAGPESFDPRRLGSVENASPSAPVAEPQ